MTAAAAPRVRPADPAEAAVLSRLARAAKAFWGYAPEQLERWRRELSISPASIRARPTFVAEVDGVAAGVVQLDDECAPWGVEHLWVDPRFMRRGVGRALLTHAVALVRRAGGVALAIDADPHAEPFYLALGARRVGEVAAPIAGQADRVRPQLVLAIAAPRS